MYMYMYMYMHTVYVYVYVFVYVYVYTIHSIYESMIIYTLGPFIVASSIKLRGFPSIGTIVDRPMASSSPMVGVEIP